MRNGVRTNFNLAVLLSGFVAEMQRPLDRQALALSSRCADQIWHRLLGGVRALASKESKLTSTVPEEMASEMSEKGPLVPHFRNTAP